MNDIENENSNLFEMRCQYAFVCASKMFLFRRFSIYSGNSDSFAYFSAQNQGITF